MQISGIPTPPLPVDRPSSQRRTPVSPPSQHANREGRVSEWRSSHGRDQWGRADQFPQPSPRTMGWDACLWEGHLSEKWRQRQARLRATGLSVLPLHLLFPRGSTRQRESHDGFGGSWGILRAQNQVLPSGQIGKADTSIRPGTQRHMASVVIISLSPSSSVSKVHTKLLK